MSRRTRALPAALLSLALGVTGLGVGALVLAPAAHAVLISGAITNVVVTPPTPTLGTQVRTTMDWCVPNGTQAGDTFTLTLSQYETSLPAGFDLDDAGGAVVATAVISNASPPVVTFTMTSYAASHLNVCGSAFFDSGFSNSIQSGQTVPFTSTTNDGQTFTSPITPTGTAPIRTQATKFATWVDADQGRTDPSDVIIWYVETSTGPYTSAVITDTVAAGQTIDCATAAMRIGDTSGPNGSLGNSSSYTGGSITCTPGSITANIGVVGAGLFVRLFFTTNLSAATGTTGQATFLNTAAATEVVNGTTVTNNPSASITQGAAGGNGGGNTAVPLVTIVKTDANGNDADTAATAAMLGTAPAGVGLNFTITNNGTDALTNVVVSDQVVANGTVTGLSCTFPGGTTGTTWAGPFAINASFGCTATLSGVALGAPHEDIASVTGVGAVSGSTVTSTNPYFATAIGTPALSIVKADSAGNAADSADAAVGLPSGSTGLLYTVTNTGTETLLNVSVSDQVVTNGTVTALNCTFPDGSTGTTWAGPFAIAATFPCTAQLSGVVTGSTHEDIGTVTGTGSGSGTLVNASNPYFATHPVAIVINSGGPVQGGYSDWTLLAIGSLLIVGGLGAGCEIARRRRRTPGAA